MILEFLAEGTDECPLLRFYDWNIGEVSLLRQAAENLSGGIITTVEVDRLPFIEVLGRIAFKWVADPQGRGVLMPRDSRHFAMQLSKEKWSDVAELIRGVEESEIPAFNWLLHHTEVAVLMSTTGHW